MTTWRKRITKVMEDRGDLWSDVEYCTLDDHGLDREFNDGFGSPEGEPFGLWTQNWIYFPTCYNGAEGVESVCRFPDGVPIKHVGGW